MERNNFRQGFAKACYELALIALGTWFTIVYVDLPHWWLLVVCGVALVVAFIAWPKASRKNNNGTGGVEKKDESQEGIWRTLWRDFWYDMLPYWVREFLGAFLLTFMVFSMLFLYSAFGKIMTWFKAL